jgi:hypothetical protein
MRGKLAAAAAAVLVAGCGGGGDPRDAVKQTTDNLGKVKSGEMTVRLRLDPRGVPGGNVGFDLKGPFALRGAGKLPDGRFDYTQIAGDRKGSATLIATGGKAWVQAGGATRPLSAQQLRQLVVPAGNGRKAGLGMLGLDISRWMRDPKLSDGPGGTDRISGSVDIVAALNDLMGAARANTGEKAPAIEGDGARRLRKAVRSSSVEVVTTDKGRLLRSLKLALDFDVPADLRRALGGLQSTKLSLDLSIARPNSPVTVKAPQGAS